MQINMIICFTVFIGGGLGSLLRYLISVIVSRWVGIAFPYATLGINISGSFLIGLLAGYFTFYAPEQTLWRLFLIVGILGGFTTFSSFSLETITLWQQGQIAATFYYVILSLSLSLTASALALNIMKATS